MKNLIRNLLVVCVGIGLVGCEWQGGGDGSSWNSRYNFVNFSGNYRGASGYLVSEYSMTSSGSSSSSTSGFIPPIQTVSGSFSGNSISFTTAFVPVKPGSVTVYFDNGAKGSVTDDGAGQISGYYLNVIPGQHPASGTIVYGNGQISIFFPDILGLQNASVTVRYTVDTGVGSGGGGYGEPGSTKTQIYTFNVFQEGNKLRIVDNNGSTYEGSFGSIRTTGGVDQDTTFPAYSDGDQVMAQFEAKGRSAANIEVRMVGSFQATIAGVAMSGTSGTTTMRLTDRRILGTWIESGGATGDINGMASPVEVSTTTEETTTTP